MMSKGNQDPQQQQENPQKTPLVDASWTKTSLMNSHYIMGLETKEDDLTSDDLFVLEIRLESQLLRDAFLTSLRLMMIRRGLPLGKLLDSVNDIIRKDIFPADEEESTMEF